MTTTTPPDPFHPRDSNPAAAVAYAVAAVLAALVWAVAVCVA